MFSVRLTSAGVAAAVVVALSWLPIVASIGEYYTSNEFAFNAACTGLAQRQAGTRFGACVPNSESSAQKYTLVSWTESTSSLVYNITVYDNTECTGAGATTQYSQTDTCDKMGTSESTLRTYSKGMTPWIHKLAAGGIVDLYWYNQNETTACSGAPDYYLATAYDYCNPIADGTSSLFVSCFSSYYASNAYSDSQCETFTRTESFSTIKCENSGNNQWRSRICGLSSDNFVSSASSDDDDDSDTLAAMTIGLSSVTSIAAGIAIVVWFFSYYYFCRFTYSPARGGGVSASV